MRLSPDAKIGALLVLFCIFMFAATFLIEHPPYASMGAEIFPRIVLLLLTPLSLALLIKGLRSSRDLDPEGGITLRAIRDVIVRYRTVLGSFVLFLLLVVLLPWLGLTVAGGLYVASMMWFLGPRTWSRLPYILLVSFAFSGGLYVVFRFVLYVLVPEGTLFQ